MTEHHTVVDRAGLLRLGAEGHALSELLEEVLSPGTISRHSPLNSNPSILEELLIFSTKIVYPVQGSGFTVWGEG